MERRNEITKLSMIFLIFAFNLLIRLENLRTDKSTLYRITYVNIMVVGCGCLSYHGFNIWECKLLDTIIVGYEPAGLTGFPHQQKKIEAVFIILTLVSIVPPIIFHV